MQVSCSHLLFGDTVLMTPGIAYRTSRSPATAHPTSSLCTTMIGPSRVSSRDDILRNGTRLTRSLSD